MIKKMFLLLLLISVHNIFSMNGSKALVVYRHNDFYALCSEGNKVAIKQFVKNNSRFNLNYQNEEGATFALHAAMYGKWGVVFCLLKCGADKNIKDNYGQSVFSKAIHEDSCQAFRMLLPLYSLKEINTECKTMTLDRGVDYDVIQTISFFVKTVLNGKRDLESKESYGYTALHPVCLQGHIPLIVDLLKRGACLKAMNKRNETPYDLLSNWAGRRHALALFAVREAA